MFVLLLGVPALPIPTGGVTHVLEVIAALLALQLIAFRQEVWLPERWRRLEVAGAGRERFIAGLMKMIRRLERISRPRLAFVFRGRASGAVFGLLVLGGTVGAFFAPRSPLSTLSRARRRPPLARRAPRRHCGRRGRHRVGAAGIVLEIVLGKAVVDLISGLF